MGVVGNGIFHGVAVGVGVGEDCKITMDAEDDWRERVENVPCDDVDGA